MKWRDGKDGNSPVRKGEENSHLIRASALVRHTPSPPPSFHGITVTCLGCHERSGFPGALVGPDGFG